MRLRHCGIQRAGGKAYDVPLQLPDQGAGAWHTKATPQLSVGRVFGRCPKLRGQQCAYFEWASHLNPNIACMHGLNYRGTVGHERAVARARAPSQPARSAHHNSVIKGTDGVTQGEANGMRDMPERVHIQQTTDNRFEFVVDCGDKPYAFVSISGGVVQSGGSG